MMSKKMNVAVLGITLVSSLCLAAPAKKAALAARPSSGTSAPPPSSGPSMTYEAPASSSSAGGGGSAMLFAVGIERRAFVGPGSMTLAHGLVLLNDKMAAGFGVGFDNGIDNLIVGGDYRMGFFSSGSTNLFAQGNLSYLKSTAGAASNSGIAVGLLAGFGYSLSSNLKVSFAYGLELGFGGAFAKHFGITNNDFVGNFGIHWYL